MFEILENKLIMFLLKMNLFKQNIPFAIKNPSVYFATKIRSQIVLLTQFRLSRLVIVTQQSEEFFVAK